jgi:predicted RNA binding protein YcfA (HicA-like mRNA interferase family)
MPHLAPQHWKTLEKVFLKDGFSFYRQDGSHRVYTKEGMARPVIIPAHHSVDVEVIKSNMRTAGLSRELYFQLLKEST